MQRKVTQVMRDAHAKTGPALFRGRRPVACLAAAALTVGAAAVSGCAARASATPSIKVATSYVAAPRTAGRTVAYVDIRNNGPADRLIAARTSVGGRVTFVENTSPRSVSVRTVPSVNVPAHGALAMDPNGVHMIITGAGPMHGGKDITLTLVFAHAGRVTVIAQVTNSESGGSSYFLN
jgi:copper(I)-binding protein